MNEIVEFLKGMALVLDILIQIGDAALKAVAPCVKVFLVIFYITLFLLLANVSSFLAGYVIRHRKKKLLYLILFSILLISLPILAADTNSRSEWQEFSLEGKIHEGRILFQEDGSALIVSFNGEIIKVLIEEEFPRLLGQEIKKEFRGATVLIFLPACDCPGQTDFWFADPADQEKFEQAQIKHYGE